MNWTSGSAQFGFSLFPVRRTRPSNTIFIYLLWSYTYFDFIIIISVCRSSPCNQKDDQDGTQLDWSGPDHVSIYEQVFFGPVASCPVFKNIIGSIKSWFTLVATGFSSKRESDHISTHISINFRPWHIKNGWELAKIWPKWFYHPCFGVIRITLTTLLIPCAINILCTSGWHPKHHNNTPNNVYHVHFTHLTSLTSYDGGQTTDMTWQQHQVMYFCFGHN